MDILRKITHRINKLLMFAAGVLLAAMVALTCANVVMRLPVIGRPIAGTYELMGLFGAVVTALALGLTQSRKENIAVDILINTFPESVRRWLRALNSLLCLAFFVVAGRQIIVSAISMARQGEVTETLHIVYYPFILLVALGCLSVAMVFLTDLLDALAAGKGGRH